VFKYEKKGDMIMNLRINNIKTFALAAMLTTSVTACKKPVNLTPLAKQYVQPRTTAIIDSLIIEGKKVAENPDYVYLGADTLELNNDFSKNPARFFEKTSLILKDKFTDKVCTKEYDYIYSDPDGVGIKHYKEFMDMYIDKTAIISSPETYTTDTTDIYIPVEYYGKVNPKVQNFL
jgi:hypothetical protein